MDSLELDVISKLNNLFSFNIKVKSFHDFGHEEVLNVYQFLLRVYDPSWILNLDRPTANILKQIQNYFHRMELGYLAPKTEDLLDSKKLCRLFGACISKLESRHNGSKNLLAIVRKIRKQKPKVAGEKETVHKQSSGSSTCDEPYEVVIPNKGKEIPRTPLTKYQPDSTSILFKSPTIIDPVPSRKPLLFSETSAKGFRPILPTKEIPRTPLKGTNLPIDSSFLSHKKNPNLTYDFSQLLTSSNTSTPYSSHSSMLNATYVLPVIGKMDAVEDSVFLPEAETMIKNHEETFQTEDPGKIIKEEKDEKIHKESFQVDAKKNDGRVIKELVQEEDKLKGNRPTRKKKVVEETVTNDETVDKKKSSAPKEKKSRNAKAPKDSDQEKSVDQEAVKEPSRGRRAKKSTEDDLVLKPNDPSENKKELQFFKSKNSKDVPVVEDATKMDLKEPSEVKGKKGVKKVKSDPYENSALPEVKAKGFHKKELAKEPVKEPVQDEIDSPVMSTAPRKSSRKKKEVLPPLNETVEIAPIDKKKRGKKKEIEKVVDDSQQEPVELMKSRRKRVVYKGADSPVPEKKARGRTKKEETPAADENSPPVVVTSDTIVAENKRGRRKVEPLINPIEDEQSTEILGLQSRQTQCTKQAVQKKPLPLEEEVQVEKETKRSRKKKEDTAVSTGTATSEKPEAVPMKKKKTAEEKEETMPKTSKKKPDIRLPEVSPINAKEANSTENKRSKRGQPNEKTSSSTNSSPVAIKPKSRRTKVVPETSNAEPELPVKRSSRTRKAN